MKIILSLFTILSSLHLAAQTTFQKVYYNNVPGFAAITTASLGSSDGGMLIVGRNASPSYNGELFIVKTDSLGALQWSKRYDTMGSFVLTRDIVETNDHGFAFTGNVASLPIDDQFVMKIDDTGKVIFARRYGSSFAESGYSIIETATNGFMTVGGTLSANGGIYLTKLDGNGSVIWSKVYSHTASLNAANTFSKIFSNSGGGYFIAGEAPVGNVPNDFSIISIDSAGVFQWGKSYGGIYPEALIDAKHTSDGGFLLAGSSRSFTTNHNLRSGILLKIDSVGNLVWTRHFPNPDVVQISSVFETQDHNIVVVANGTKLIKLDSEGNFIWCREYSSIGGGKCVVSELLTGNGYLMSGGSALLASPPNPDYFLIRTDDSGKVKCLGMPTSPPIIDTVLITNNITITLVGTLDTSSVLSVIATKEGRDSTICSGVITNMQNLQQSESELYPNPTTGSFALVCQAAGMLTLTDPQGRTIGNYKVHIGGNTIVFDEKLPGGLYFGRLQVLDGSGHKIMKIMLQR